jgi:hypothetical protein
MVPYKILPTHIYLLQVIFNMIDLLLLSHTGRDSTVGIATRYGLKGLGIDSQWEARFSLSVQTGLPVLQWIPGLFLRQSGRGVAHPPKSSAEVTERVELYLYSAYEPSWSLLGRTLPLTSLYAVG